MRVTFWGTRGSVPTPGPIHRALWRQHMRASRLRTDAGTFFIFDSGTGIRELGLHLARQDGPVVGAPDARPHPLGPHLGLSVLPARLSCPAIALVDLRRARSRPLAARRARRARCTTRTFPVPLGDLRAEIDFCELDEGEIHIDDAVVRTHYLNHTAVCMGYRIEADGVSVAYITDHEPYGTARATSLRRGARVHPRWRPAADRVRARRRPAHPGRAVHARGVPARRGWGHGSTDYVTDVAVEAGCAAWPCSTTSRPTPTTTIDRMVEYARRARLREAGSQVEVFAAAEGQEIASDSR